MTKSRSRKAAKAKRRGYQRGKLKTSKKPKVSDSSVLMGTITITEEGKLAIDQSGQNAIKTFAGGPVIWLVNNMHANPHLVSIDPDKIHKKGAGKLNPFPSNGPLKSENL
ncbi:MAG TPA: hypothetical protein VKE42_01225, partial [Candidatus Cybelea sp.]|nr:hypothetical protein [Candidatus Cybelea sp.]